MPLDRPTDHDPSTRPQTDAPPRHDRSTLTRTACDLFFPDESRLTPGPSLGTKNPRPPRTKSREKVPKKSPTDDGARGGNARAVAPRDGVATRRTTADGRRARAVVVLSRVRRARRVSVHRAVSLRIGHGFARHRRVAPNAETWRSALFARCRRRDAPRRRETGVRRRRVRRRDYRIILRRAISRGRPRARARRGREGETPRREGPREGLEGDPAPARDARRTRGNRAGRAGAMRACAMMMGG